MNHPKRNHDERAPVSKRIDRGGFTLVELLLTVALVLLVAGALILNLGALDSNARLEEGAAHVETLFRYARAQAANTGRQVRIVFRSNAQPAGTPAVQANSPSNSPSSSIASSGTNEEVQVLWEPNPVSAPGQFETFPGAELIVAQVNELVKVRKVGPPGESWGKTGNQSTNDGSSSFQTSQLEDTNALAGVESITAMPPLTCYPDGSSDSAEIVLSAASGEDKRLAVVTLWGISGTARHQLVPASDATADLSGDWDLLEP